MEQINLVEDWTGQAVQSLLWFRWWAIAPGLGIWGQQITPLRGHEAASSMTSPLTSLLARPQHRVLSPTLPARCKARGQQTLAGLWLRSPRAPVTLCELGSHPPPMWICFICIFPRLYNLIGLLPGLEGKGVQWTFAWFIFSFYVAFLESELLNKA